MFIAPLVTAIPLLPAFAALAIGLGLPGFRLASQAAGGAALLSAAAGILLLSQGDVATWSLGISTAPWTLTFRFDAIAAVMALLVASLGWTVARYSARFMAGERRADAYHRNLLLALTAVLTLVLAGNLVVLFLAWVGTSAALHALLLHYPERPGAQRAAWKKFAVSRLGDVCLVTAIVGLWRSYGTIEFDALFAAATANSNPLTTPVLLLAAGAAIKSAQFPFHGWLPETMETPTPVSAFMHAGIINAGGFLVIRLHPLFREVPLAMHLLAIIGTLTAAFGAIVMLTQPSVKRALAYSTIAQMGFMLLECGLGAFGLALLHLLAHSVYKAHAFLTSGSTVGAIPRAAAPLRTGALVAGAIVAGGIVAATAPWLGGDGATRVLGLVLWLAVAYGLARAWSVASTARIVILSLAAAVAFVAATVALHHGASAIVPNGPTPPTWLLGVVAAVFVALFAVQMLVWRADRHAWSRALYVHALNGFYVDALAQRWFGRWQSRAQ